MYPTTRRNYTDEFKIQAVALAEAHGLKRAQIIESLMRMEAEAGVYLTDD